jgi:hypothetical protein
MTDIIQTNISKIQKLTKYILMGLIVVLATKYIPDNNLQIKEIIMIGATSSISFAILDMISPAVSINSNSKPQSAGQEVQVETKPKTKSNVVVEAFVN